MLMRWHYWPGTLFQVESTGRVMGHFDLFQHCSELQDPRA